MSDDARANLLKIRSDYVEQLENANALLAQVPESSEDAAEANQWLVEARSEIAIIDQKLAALGPKS